MHPALVPAFEQWLDERHLELVRVPSLEESDDLPTHIISIKQSHPSFHE
jgi:hypothetical protein